MNRLKSSPEWMILVSLLLLLGAWGFKSYEAKRLERVRQESRETRLRIEETLALKKLWDTKGLEKKLEGVKSLIPAEGRKKFLKKKRSLEIRAEGLEGRKLNRLLGKLGALPLQFQSLAITRDKDRYTLECRCKW
jgi:hypothetical protein